MNIIEIEIYLDFDVDNTGYTRRWD
jgi:hypothetical protein